MACVINAKTNIHHIAVTIIIIIVMLHWDKPEGAADDEDSDCRLYQCKTNPIDGYGSLSSSSYTRHLSHHQFHFNATIIIIRKTKHKDKSQIVFHYHHHQIYQRLEISCLEYLPKDSLQSETIPHWNHSLRFGWCVTPQGLNCCQFQVTNITPQVTPQV